jgi:hypothetical protein
MKSTAPAPLLPIPGFIDVKGAGRKLRLFMTIRFLRKIIINTLLTRAPSAGGWPFGVKNRFHLG